MHENVDTPVTCLAALGYLGLLGLFFVQGETWFYWSADEKLAAWVQAVGSIAAIIAGAAAIAWQGQHQVAIAARAARAEDVRRLRLVWSLVYETRVWLEFANKKLLAAIVMRPPGSKATIDALRHVRVFDLPDSLAFSSITLGLAADLGGFGGKFLRPPAALRRNSGASCATIRRRAERWRTSAGRRPGRQRWFVSGRRARPPTKAG